ncbi:hypothetical protein [Pseudomonas putida]
MEDYRDALRSAAESIAKEAGAIKECEFHGDLIDNDNLEEAITLGNSLFTTTYQGVFESREEMEEAIRDVVSDASWDCGMCEKNADS